MTLVLLCRMTSEDIKTEESKTLGLCVCDLLLKGLDNVLFSSMTTQQGTRQLHTMVGSRLAVESSVAASMSVQCCDCDSSSADAAVNHVVVLKRVSMSLFSSRKLCVSRNM